MKVICVNLGEPCEAQPRLTISGVYDIIDTYDEYIIMYRIRNDDGYISTYSSKYFMTVEEYRNERIDKILL